MDYLTLAKQLNSAMQSFKTALIDIDANSFDDVWSGDVHDTLTRNLKNAIAKVEKQNDAIETYISALEELQKYKENKEKIDMLSQDFNTLTDSKEDSTRRSILTSSISNLEGNNITLRRKIESCLKSISSISTEYELVNYSADNYYGNYVVDLYSFLNLFKSGALSKLNNTNKSNDSLYDFYTEEEIEKRINEIKKMYSGRDAAVNCALGIMEMAASVGKKLNHDWGKGHAEETGSHHVATGVDCSAFVSWAINQGSKSKFNTMTTSGLVSQGIKTSFENAQKGDILVSSGSAVMIIDNDVERQQFLVAEANGLDTGIIMNTRSYASLSGTYQARDLSSIYNS